MNWGLNEETVALQNIYLEPIDKGIGKFMKNKTFLPYQFIHLIS